MKLFHASQTPGIQVLEPRVSNHGRPLLYFSDRRENTLVYLCNAIERHWLASGFPPCETYHKWGSYGFTGEGLLCLEEYWPGATEETYGGAAGYVYTVETEKARPLPEIPHAFTLQEPIRVTVSEFVPNALEALKQAERAGKLALRSYGENSPDKLQWIEQAIRREYEESDSQPYREFLQAKFPQIKGTAEKCSRGV